MSSYFPSLKDLAGQVILDKELSQEKLDKDCLSFLSYLKERRFLLIDFSSDSKNFLFFISEPLQAPLAKLRQGERGIDSFQVEISTLPYLKISCLTGKISFSKEEVVKCYCQKGEDLVLLLPFSSLRDKIILFGNYRQGLLFYYLREKIEHFHGLPCKKCFLL